MKRLFNSCRQYREALCIAMNDDLPTADRATLTAHLATCAGCQKYRDEIGNVAALLSASRELFVDVQLDEATRARWASDFEAATKTADSSATKNFRRFRDWYRGLFLPCRWIWTGMAAVWLMILGLNLSQRTPKETQIAHRPSPEMMRALLAAEGFLLGPNSSEKKRDAQMPEPVSPQPRSDQYRNNKPS